MAPIKLCSGRNRNQNYYLSPSANTNKQILFSRYRVKTLLIAQICGVKRTVKSMLTDSQKLSRRVKRSSSRVFHRKKNRNTTTQRNSTGCGKHYYKKVTSGKFSKRIGKLRNDEKKREQKIFRHIFTGFDRIFWQAL